MATSEDARAADEGSVGEPGPRARGGAPGPAPRGQGAAGAGDGHHDWIGPAELTETALSAWGERIGAAVIGPAFFALRGELGAGKSVLARAIARGAGVRARMPSPTFNLLFRYDAAGETTVAHLDLYRLNHPDEVWELGWRELGAGREIVLVEWPERAEALLPPDRWDIHLEAPHALADVRRVRAIPHGRAPALPAP